MTATPKPVHLALRDARRAQGLTQSDIAREINCTQSAISMFEAGRTNALSAETIAQIARKLGVDAKALPSSPARPPVFKYCPVDECPMNVPFVVRGEILFTPTLTNAPDTQMTRCPFCGELMESHCPGKDCGAPVANSSCCPDCGTRYVPSCRAVGTPAKWAEKQRANIKELLEIKESLRLRA